MSDTAAFIAGCAVSGVAALFLMRNELASSRSDRLQDYPASSPTPTVSASSSPSPFPDWVMRDPNQDWRFETKLEQQRDTAEDLSQQLIRQQSATENLQNRTEDLKGWVEKQQQQTETLRDQLEQQQRTTEQLLGQLQEQQRLLDRVASDRGLDPAVRPIAPLPSPRDPNSDDNSLNLQTIALWIVGGILCVVLVGGGFVLILIVILVSTSRRRPTGRAVQVVHPFTPQYMFTEQPRALPPSRVRSRPPTPRSYDYDFYED